MSSPFDATGENRMPGISDITNSQTANLYSNFNVKYLKVDMDSPSAISILEEIETRAIRGAKIAILTRDKFTFMDRYFMIISYMEENS